MPTPALTSIVALIVVAAALWILNVYIPLAGNMKRIVNVVLVLILVGIVLWLINTYIPMAGSIKAILNIVVVIATCVGVLQAVGLWGEVVQGWNKLTSTITATIRGDSVSREASSQPPPAQAPATPETAPR
ncbi:MAG: Thivi_2564 family membrane protein [Bryobacteraceae bacterium]|jgi:predicted membrane protein